MSSKFHAQEIEDNQINENKEALLHKKSLENGTYENAIKTDLNKETKNIISGVNDNPLVFLPKNAFSYTKNCNITNKPKPPLFPKPRDRQRVNFNKIVSLAGKMQHSEVKIDSKPINIDASSLISNDSERIDDPDDSSNSKIHREEDYSKLEDTEMRQPPLPSRPPPVFKYPLGTFYKEEHDLKEATKEHQIKCSQMFCQSDRMEKLVNLNDEISGIVTSSDYLGNNSLTEFGVGVERDICKSFSQETNSLGIQKKLMKASDETKEIKKPFPTPIAGQEANKPTRKTIAPGDFLKIPKSIPLEPHENKSPQPIPRPELPIKKENKNTSENIPSVFSNKSNRIQLGIKNPVLDLELKRNAECFPKPKTQAKPSVPPKASSLFHQRIEQILVEQRIREQECLNPVNRLKPPLEERLTEFSEDDWMGQSTIQENKSQARKMSLENSNKSKMEESFISKFENSLNSKIENIRMDPSSAELRDEQCKVDLKQDHIVDFHSLNRPTLPQKMKSTQRSLSYTSLVQTVKDIGSTIWNPSDKSKRSSTGMTTKVTEGVIGKNETLNSASGGKFLEIQRSFEEEKDEIVRSSWFHDVSATEAQHRLLKLDQDGAFLIRPTSRPTDVIQYTASITYAGRVFNIHIRRKANYYFALGKEGEKSFQRLSDLIKHYQDVPFDIHPAGSSNTHAICFRVTPPH